MASSNLKTRSGNGENIFLKDGDWKVLKMQLLKLSRRIDLLVEENRKLKKDLEKVANSETIVTRKDIEIVKVNEVESDSGFTFIL